MSAKHTKEPWFIHNGIDIDGTQDHRARLHIADCAPDSYDVGLTDIDVPIARANADRIVACVNACTGINPAAIQKLLEACKKANTCASIPDEIKTLIRDAIAEARQS